jgi:hypothetical protein
MFASIQQRARCGDTVKCADQLARVLFPGIVFHSLDGEEACWVAAVRSALAKYPCPRCLVHQDDLHNITKEYPIRTVLNMQQVYEDAVNASTKTERERILQGSGLHFTKVFPPSRQISSPLAHVFKP